MKLYLAGFDNEKFRNYLKDLKPMNILISYFYSKNLNGLPKHKNLLVDSGGYSARTQNVNIDVDKYGKWLFEKDIDNYFNLDSKDLDETKKNQNRLENMGLNPIPIWHPQHGKKELEELISSYDYIGIGNITGGNTGSRKRREKVLNFIKQYKDTKFHLFGVTDKKLIKKYQNFFYSTDSTSWNAGGRYGHFYYFNRGQLKKIGRKKDYLEKFANMKDYNKRNKWNLVQWKKYADYLQEDKI